MPKKKLTGIVIAKSGDKTYKVEVRYTRQHPIYRKIIHIRRRFLVYCDQDVKIGSKVVIEETRRLSKHKHFKIINVLEESANA